MYSIISFKAQPDGLITEINWCYTNNQGSIRSKLTLPNPGSLDSIIPLSNVLPENLIDFVRTSIDGSQEVLDIKISDFATAQEYQNSLLTYVIDEDGSFVNL